MTVEKFKTDLTAAKNKVDSGNIKGLTTIKEGISDGEVILVFDHQNLPVAVRIHALAPDLGEYPDCNTFMLYTEMDDPPESVTGAIKDAADFMLGLSVYEMASEVARYLRSRLNAGLNVASDCDSNPSDQEDLEDDPDTDDQDCSDLEDYGFDDDATFGLSDTRPRPSRPLHPVTVSPDLLQRVRRDLKQVHDAGYKLGILDSFGRTSTSGIFSISIRVDALDLSEGTMEAWDLGEDEYIVLLIRTESYLAFEHLIEGPGSDGRTQYRIGKCQKHKPSLEQALLAFGNGGHDKNGDDSYRFNKLFLSNSLDQFMDESFVPLSKFRDSHLCNWEQANEALHNISARSSLSDNEGTDLLFDPMDVEDTHQQRHTILLHDHLREKHQERSFPLIAMQFAMQYFIRCTEYCLRCHRKLEKGFEALRPYVCSNPLCLFQYMSMGFGPSIEHEILTEPYVVDLLVSLCYAALQPYYSMYAANSTAKLPIRDMPVGLRLKVPDLSGSTPPKFLARIQDDCLFWDENICGLEAAMAPSKWIAFRSLTHMGFQHARIIDFNSGTKSAMIETVATSGAIKYPIDDTLTMTSILPSLTPPPPPPPLATSTGKSTDGEVEIEIFPYEMDFDDLDMQSQALAMRGVLDTLPSILEIEEWLSENPQRSFKEMKSISPAAACLLQWIVSSNRSCIFQVDRDRSVAKGMAGKPGLSDPNKPAGRGRNREHERIIGMPGWIQFRFAQGSPDKELRFTRALQEIAHERQMSHPTIFAWHGSPLCNWHSIVRTGLDFKEVRFGRAYGNGVYFSPHFSTSVGYVNSNAGQQWPKSHLEISLCMSLNEIINAPDKFVSRAPHYVVAQEDWHQCRYLFVSSLVVRGSKNAAGEKGANNTNYLSFADGLAPMGQSRQALKIPSSAIPTRVITTTQDSAIPAKRTRSQSSPIRDDHEDAEDVAIVLETLELDNDLDRPVKRQAQTDQSNVQAAPTLSVDKSLTDFVPGALDLSSLPRLDPPLSANDSALKAIGREIKSLQAVQARTPLHELGWYMDFDQVTNLFQWIVELHSFDPSLPLAKDMKSAGVTSIVTELRFPADYPFAPPFVRIVRPRFLPFMNGGGGHVTMGGAMCMELLTSSGWSPANGMESVLLQVRMALCSTDPKPARLNLTRPSTRSGVHQQDYNVGEAVEAYIRAAKNHAWQVPLDLKKTAGLE